jgi:putative FmdB family regulatory protein
MPIYDIRCQRCGQTAEVIVTTRDAPLVCPECGSHATDKVMSATSSLTGRTGNHLPGPADTGCCGSHPGEAGCAGPGSCCGKTSY